MKHHITMTRNIPSELRAWAIAHFSHRFITLECLGIGPRFNSLGVAPYWQWLATVWRFSAPKQSHNPWSISTFSKVDLVRCYHQVPGHRKDVPKTAVVPSIWPCWITAEAFWSQGEWRRRFSTLWTLCYLMPFGFVCAFFFFTFINKTTT